MGDPDVVVVVLAESDDSAVGDAAEIAVAVEVLAGIDHAVVVDVLRRVLAAVLERVGVHRHAVPEELARSAVDVEPVAGADAVAVESELPWMSTMAMTTPEAAATTVAPGGAGAVATMSMRSLPWLTVPP